MQRVRADGEHALQKANTSLRRVRTCVKVTRHTLPNLWADSKGDLWKVFAYFLLSEKVGARPA